jgi:hypothetical protein
MINIMVDLKRGEAALRPEAEALFKQRGANLLRDNPMIRCLRTQWKDVNSTPR